MSRNTNVKNLVQKKTKATARKALSTKVDSETRVLKREEFIKIKSMFPDKQEKYFKIDKADKRYTSLEESLLNVGIGDDPCVLVIEDEYKLVTGHRRQLIVEDHPESNMFDFVSIKVLHWSIEKALIFFFDSNIKGGREIDEISYAEMLEEEIELYRKMQEDTGKKFNINLLIAEQQGKSKRSVERQVSLTKLTPKLKEQVRDGKLKKNTASVISTMDNEVQKALSEREDVGELTEKDARVIKKSEPKKVIETVKESETVAEITKKLLDIKDVIKHEFEMFSKSIGERIDGLSEEHSNEETLNLSRNIRSIALYAERLRELIEETHNKTFGNNGNLMNKTHLDYINNSTLIQKVHSTNNELRELDLLITDFIMKDDV